MTRSTNPVLLHRSTFLLGGKYSAGVDSNNTLQKVLQMTDWSTDLVDYVGLSFIDTSHLMLYTALRGNQFDLHENKFSKFFFT